MTTPIGLSIGRSISLRSRAIHDPAGRSASLVRQPRTKADLAWLSATARAACWNCLRKRAD